MKEFLNEKVNIIVSTKSGGGTGSSISCGTLATVTNNTINIRGTLKSIDDKFLIIEDVQLIELPQYGKANPPQTELGTLSYNYKKTAINIDNIVTISIV